jgi:HlyD family secretion protein
MNLHRASRSASCLVLALCATSGCSQKVPETLPGYVEVEPVRVAAGSAGRLVTLAVQRGDAAKAGQTLFTLDTSNEQAALAETQARLGQAQAQSADLTTGKRADELAVIDANLAAAQAAQRQSQAELVRTQELARTGFLSPNALDGVQAKRDGDAARVSELQAQLRVARLAARGEQLQGARAGVQAGAALVAQTQWKLEQRSASAPVDARVEDTYFRVGEWVPAGSPVVSLLAPDALKLRFYVPEPWLTRMRAGTKVQVICHGCAKPVPATVRYVSREAEFTPPVIYSNEARNKLVWLAEAWPEPADAALLVPGQPVDITVSP